MGKVDAQMQARMDGMAYALRIAKKEGIEGLEEELKRRGITGMNLPASHKEIDQELDKIKMQVLDTVLAMSCLVLRDEFNFGAKRLNRFKDRFNFKTECLQDEHLTWADILEVIREETGIELQIRENR
ncbi:hypothetical protein [Anaerostipes faecalis]|uniref:hypothetical protein n=1 Tax=Anaerostipes faecalis TaxID=2738446 RepID=UPI003F071881